MYVVPWQCSNTAVPDPVSTLKHRMILSQWPSEQAAQSTGSVCRSRVGAFHMSLIYSESQKLFNTIERGFQASCACQGRTTLCLVHEIFLGHSQSVCRTLLTAQLVHFLLLNIDSQVKARQRNKTECSGIDLYKGHYHHFSSTTGKQPTILCRKTNTIFGNFHLSLNPHQRSDMSSPL